jgi:hypothetical protein
MGREVKRVPKDFNWPLNKIWEGFLSPDGLSGEEYEKWYTEARHEPPTGDCWQLWEDVTEGSPVSPVFDTSSQLIEWMEQNGYSDWAIQWVSEGETWLPSGVGILGNPNWVQR